MIYETEESLCFKFILNKLAYFRMAEVSVSHIV